MAKYDLILKTWQIFSVSPKWKINIASLMIPQWNQPSMFIPKMVSSNFAGVQKVYITTNQTTRLVHIGTNGGIEQEFLHRRQIS